MIDTKVSQNTIRDQTKKLDVGRTGLGHHNGLLVNYS